MTTASPSILYLGLPSGGELSRQPLAALLDSGARICAVVVPGGRSSAHTPDPQPLAPEAPPPEALPIVAPYLSPNVVTLAWERGLPVLAVRSFTRAFEALAALEPDLICVSCFSRIIPPALLALPRYGALNLHPSLLPRYRGPAPLFWQFKNGETHPGVTVHFMNERPDAGDILLQEAMLFRDGMTAREAEALAARAGSALLVRALGLVRGGDPPRRPQSEPEATYAPMPARSDYALSTAQPARRAFNFIRGVGEGPFEIRIEDEVLRIRDAVEYSPEMILNLPCRREGDEAWIQFEPGVLRVKVP